MNIEVKWNAEDCIKPNNSGSSFWKVASSYSSKHSSSVTLFPSSGWNSVETVLLTLLNDWARVVHKNILRCKLARSPSGQSGKGIVSKAYFTKLVSSLWLVWILAQFSRISTHALLSISSFSLMGMPVMKQTTRLKKTNAKQQSNVSEHEMANLVNPIASYNSWQ